jgi:hypothetical protein
MPLAAKFMNKPILPMNKLVLKRENSIPIVLARVVIIKSVFFVRQELKKAPPRTPAIPPM